MNGITASTSPTAPAPRRSFLLQPGREVAVEFGVTLEPDATEANAERREALECAADYVRVALEELERRGGIGFELWHPPGEERPAIRWPVDFGGHEINGPDGFAAYLCAVLDRAGRVLHVHDSAGRAFRLHVSPHFHRASMSREVPR